MAMNLKRKKTKKKKENGFISTLFKKSSNKKGSKKDKQKEKSNVNKEPPLKTNKEKSQTINQTVMNTTVKICEKLETIDGRLNIEPQEIVPAYSNINGKFMDLQVVVVNQGIAVEPIHQYLIIREEGHELNPGKIIARKVSPGVPIKDLDYYLLENIPINDMESTYEIVTLNVKEKLDDILLHNQDYMEVKLEKPLLERIFEVGTITNTIPFLTMPEYLIKGGRE